MAAGTYDLELEQGATFALTVTWRDSASAPINLTGYTARMQIRKTVSAPTTILSLTDANGGLTLGGAAGTIAIAISATQTAAITASAGVYDLELVAANGFVTRVLEGSVNISKEVTR